MDKSLDGDVERALAPVEVPDIKISEISLFDLGESKHRKARYLRMGNKHWTRKALSRKRTNRDIANKSRRNNR